MTISNTAMTEATKIIGTVSAGITVAKYQASGIKWKLWLIKCGVISFRIRPWYNPTNNYSNLLSSMGYVRAIVHAGHPLLHGYLYLGGKKKRKGWEKELLRCLDSAFSIILGKFLVYCF